MLKYWSQNITEGREWQLRHAPAGGPKRLVELLDASMKLARVAPNGRKGAKPHGALLVVLHLQARHNEREVDGAGDAARHRDGHVQLRQDGTRQRAGGRVLDAKRVAQAVHHEQARRLHRQRLARHVHHLGLGVPLAKVLWDRRLPQPHGAVHAVQPHRHLLVEPADIIRRRWWLALLPLLLLVLAHVGADVREVVQVRQQRGADAHAPVHGRRHGHGVEAQRGPARLEQGLGRLGQHGAGQEARVAVVKGAVGPEVGLDEGERLPANVKELVPAELEDKVQDVPAEQQARRGLQPVRGGEGAELDERRGGVLVAGVCVGLCGRR